MNDKNYKLCMVCHEEPCIPHKPRCRKCHNEFICKWYNASDKAKKQRRNYQFNLYRTDPEYKKRKLLRNKEYMKTYSKSEAFSLSTIKSHIQRLSITNLDIAINMLTERRIELMGKHKKDVIDSNEIRIKELEMIAHNNMTGEDIANQLEDVDPALRKEYNKLMYDWDA